MTETELEEKAEDFCIQLNENDPYAFPYGGEELRQAYIAGYKQGEHDNSFCAGCYDPKNKWHFCKNDDYPPLVELPDGGDYNPLVLVFWLQSDDYGQRSSVFALDRWCPELKLWEEHNRRGIIAWQSLPQIPEVEA